MSVLNLFHHGFALLWLCHVALNHERLGQLIGHLHRVRLILLLLVGDVIDDALRPVCAESLYHFRADSARAASDQHNFPGEIQWIAHNDSWVPSEYRRIM